MFQLKVLDGEKEQKGREVAELQARLSVEEQREEDRVKEVFTLKQKLTEAETARNALKTEVRMEQRLVFVPAVFYMSRFLLLL